MSDCVNIFCWIELSFCFANTRVGTLPRVTVLVICCMFRRSLSAVLL